MSAGAYAWPTMKTWRFSLIALLALAGVSFVQAEDAAAKPAGEAAAPVAPPKVENGYLNLSFEHLASFTFTPPPFDPLASPNVKPPTGEEQIPAEVKAWNG